MLCKYCNAENRDSSQFCMSCGQRLEPSDNATRKLPESNLPPYTPPPTMAPPSAYTPPPAAAKPPSAHYTPPRYTPPSYTPPGSPPPQYSQPPNQAAAASRLPYWVNTRAFKLAAGGIVLLFALLAGWLLFSRFMPSLLPGGKEILLAVPRRSDEYDLYMVKAGQALDDAVLLADAAHPVSGEARIYYAMTGSAYQVVPLASDEFGGFIPDSNRLLYWYWDEDDLYVKEISTSDDAPQEIMATDALPLYGLLFADSDNLFLQETRSSQERCYAANPGQAAERITKGNVCWATQDGAYIWAEERNAGETSLSLYPLTGKGDPITVLEDQEDVGQFMVSPNGSHVAYIQYERNEWQLVSVNTKDGAVTEVGEPGESIPQFGYLGNTGILFYILQNDEEIVELFVSTQTTPLAEGVGMAAVSSDDGRFLLYQVVDEDGESTVVSYDVNTGTSQSILTEDNLEFNVIPAHNVVLLSVQDGNELLLYRANIDGSNVELLLDETHVSLDSLQYTLDQDRLYVLMNDDDGYSSLFTTSLSTADGFYLLEDWYDITLLNQSSNGRSLVFTAQEDPGDDYILYTIEQEKGAALVELDDQYDYYANAVFTENGRDVIYTGIGDSSADDFDVLQVAADGKDSAEVLYPEAHLLSVRWDWLSPFQYAYFTYVYTSN